MRILLVEDHKPLVRALKQGLEEEGFAVDTAYDGEEGDYKGRTADYDVIILDLMLPKVDGLALLQNWREHGLRSHVLVLTARNGIDDKVRGLDMGADDYVTKPFSPRELVARIRAVIRRGKQAEPAGKKTRLTVGELRIDRERFEVTMQGQAVELTRKEFELLGVLAGTPGRVFGRDELLDLVWGRDGFVEPRTVDVHVARLRAKFIAAKLPPPGVETVRGVGYRFREQSPSERGTNS